MRFQELTDYLTPTADLDKYMDKFVHTLLNQGRKHELTDGCFDSHPLPLHLFPSLPLPFSSFP